MTKNIPLISLLALPLALFANSPPQPWFKGPYGVHSGQSLSRGEQRYDVGLGFTSYVSSYNAWYNYKYFATEFVTRVGVLRNLDIRLSVPTNFIIKDHMSNPKNLGIGDISLGIGYQILRDRKKTLQPDMRLILTEQLPTDTYHGNRRAVLHNGPTLKIDKCCTTELVLATQKLLCIDKQFISLRLNIGWAYTPWHTVRHTYMWMSQTWRSRCNTVFLGLSIEQSLSSRWATSLSILKAFSYHQSKCSHHPNLVTSFTNSYVISPQLQYNSSKNLGFSLGGNWTHSAYGSKRLGVYFKITWIVP